jgi:hypothetical protein
MADEIGLADIIDRCCKWDKTRCKISPGEDVEAFFGEGVTTHDFNDDVLGRNLDRLFVVREQGSWRGYLLRARKA